MSEQPTQGSTEWYIQFFRGTRPSHLAPDQPVTPEEEQAYINNKLGVLVFQTKRLIKEHKMTEALTALIETHPNQLEFITERSAPFPAIKSELEKLTPKSS